MLLLMFIPWTPPPLKNVMAQKAPIITPADPFDNINLLDPRRMPKQKIRTIGGIPVNLIPK